MESLEIEKSIYLLKYIKIENSQTKDLHDKARDSFLNEIKMLHYEMNVYDDELDKDYVEAKLEPEESQSTQKESQNQKASEDASADNSEEDIPVKSMNHPGWAKKLYRKIAMKTHPDRFKKSLSENEKEKLVRIYENSTESYNAGVYGELILHGIDVGAEIPRDPGALSHVSDLTVMLERESTELRKTVFWVWYHSTEEEKKKILYEYVKIRGWTDNGSGIRKSPSRKKPGKSIAWLRKKLES